jgi:ABC-type nitrate/sulfonate/bicarbonate transport system permease component
MQASTDAARRHGAGNGGSVDGGTVRSLSTVLSSHDLAGRVQPPTGPAQQMPWARLRTNAMPVLLGTLGSLVCLCVWELASRTGIAPSEEVPPASTVIGSLTNVTTSHLFWQSAGDTMTQWALGFALSIVVAMPVGLLLGSNEATWRAFRPLVEFFRTVPGSSLIPLAILLWGLSLRSVVFLIVFGCAWSLVIQTMYGVHEVDEGARNTARAFRLTRLERARWVVLPSALPYAATGLRIAASTALIIAISAEILIGVPGIGHDIALARTAGQVDRMYALILVSGVLGILINVAFSGIERHFLRWHESQRRWSDR